MEAWEAAECGDNRSGVRGQGLRAIDFEATGPDQELEGKEGHPVLRIDVPSAECY